MRAKWALKILVDVARMSFVNRSYGMGLSIFGLFILGLLFSAAQVSAPFIYTLF
jgi:hypothetical protein